ncbi:MAG: hypothetical protein K0B15_11825 [Lentimicrobium sp.]|nr:hypothetical protein [Lentimicrobium sp.]
MREIKINEDVFLIPGSWNELSIDELLKIGFLSLYNHGYIDFVFKLFLFVTGIKIAINPEILDEAETLFLFKKGKKKNYLISSDDLLEICHSFDFLFDIDQDNDKNQYVLSSRLTKNIIGPVNVGNTLWYGPANAVTNLKTDEYIRAETSLFQYHKTQEEIHLDRLVATLWRPASAVPASDDIRVKFDDGIVNSSAEKAATIPPHIKQAIYLFYSGCRRFLSSRFPNSSSQKSNNEKDIFFLFLKMVNGLANNDVTKHESVRSAYLIDTMVCIDEFARQQNEMEKLNKRTR